MNAALIRCYGCGAWVPATDGPTHRYIGAAPGCWALHGEVAARMYADFRFGKFSQLIVDSYAAQHPGVPSPQAIQSVAVHLISLYHVLELNHPPYESLALLQRAADLSAHYVWLEPPAAWGELTIVDLHQATTLADHERLAWAWARSIWQAWSAHHTTIRQWAALR